MLRSWRALTMPDQPVAAHRRITVLGCCLGHLLRTVNRRVRRCEPSASANRYPLPQAQNILAENARQHFIRKLLRRRQPAAMLPAIRQALAIDIPCHNSLLHGDRGRLPSGELA